MKQDIIDLIGEFEHLPWMPEVICAILLILLVTVGLNFIFYLIASIFKF